ncbi:MAG: hypothetical protein DWQ35_14775 [Planctomycetota bacterium]|nr:MAG: hypothetical protein DWQ35_14775 [Planctomycetota bacterium]
MLAMSNARSPRPHRYRALVGIPSYDGTLVGGAAFGACLWATRYEDVELVSTDPAPGGRTGQLGRGEVTVRISQGSLIGATFNALWCAACDAYERDECDYFAMLHADVTPGPEWLDTLVDELVRLDADLVACCVPIKSDEGLTSTAIADVDDPWNIEGKLNFDELRDLPPTFSIRDTPWRGDPKKCLLVNTGCFVVDLAKAWTRETDEDGIARFRFSVEDRIRVVVDPKTGRSQRQAQVCSEAWAMSRYLAKIGARVFATTKVAITHCGDHAWTLDRSAHAAANREASR